jgi:pimeloyl-ACP methyl ester carboxylesterase
VIALLLIAALHATPAPTISEPYTHAQSRVDIGDGRHLNLYCVGNGSPTVIFDSGSEVGSGTLPWDRVQPAVAQFTRACSYDRAGYGFSDPGPLPRTSDAVVSDLHALLARAGIPPPYVLVAHSTAGLYEPLFADRYQDEVAGMVLVDPSAAGQEELFSSQYPKYAANREQQLAKLHECGDDPAQKQCQLPPTMERTSAAWKDPASELESISVDGAEVSGATHGYGTMPLIVLTATQDGQAMQTTMGASKAQVAYVENGWIAMHDQLAAQSSRGVNCVIAGVGHAIQTDKPDDVIEAIRQVIRLIPIEEKPSCAAWPSPKPAPTDAPRK